MAARPGNRCESDAAASANRVPVGENAARPGAVPLKASRQRPGLSAIGMRRLTAGQGIIGGACRRGCADLQGCRRVVSQGARQLAMTTNASNAGDPTDPILLREDKDGVVRLTM